MEGQEYLRLEEKKPQKHRVSYNRPSNPIFINYIRIAASKDNFVNIYCWRGPTGQREGRTEEGRRHITIELGDGTENWIPYGEIIDKFGRRSHPRVKNLLKNKELYEELFIKEEQVRKTGKLEGEILRF